MHKQAQIERAAQFRALHDRRQVLLLANAWDAASACVFSDLGFSAIATTSGGVAWSLGYPDGEQAPLAEVVAARACLAAGADCVYPLGLSDRDTIAARSPACRTWRSSGG